MTESDSADPPLQDSAQVNRSNPKDTDNPANNPTPSRKKGGLTWSELSSSDLESFAENLRAVGCPEQLIADLLVPEITRKFGRGATASYLHMVKSRLPWTPSPEWEDWSLGTEFSEIEDEYDELITKIFGEQYAGERGWRKWSYWNHRIQVREEKLAFLHPAMREVVDVQESERYTLKRKLRRSNPRPTDQEIEDQVLQSRLAHLQQLRKEHPAEKVEEYLLRSSHYAAIPRSIPGLEFTVDEMKQITRHFEEGRIANDPEFADTFGQVRELLGDARFRTFEPAARKELEEIARRQKY